MAECIKCGKSVGEVKLFRGITNEGIILICKRCSLFEDIPLIIDNSQKDIENHSSFMKDRLKKMAGINVEKTKLSLYEELKQLDSNSELEKPEKIDFNLVDNYYWIIQTTRRRKGYSLKKLAEAIRESEESLRMIENKAMPKGSLNILKKLERFFGIELIKKDSPFRDYKKEELPEPFNSANDYSENKKSLEMQKMQIKEAEEMLDIAISEEKSPLARVHESVGNTPLKLVDFKKHDLKDSNIADLKRMNERVEGDFTKKSSFQVGKEQMEDIGKEDIEKLKKTIYRNYVSSSNSSSNARPPINLSESSSEKISKTPTIYELMKKKEERDRQMTGNEIDIVREEKL